MWIWKVILVIPALTKVKQQGLPGVQNQLGLLSECQACPAYSVKRFVLFVCF